MNIGLRVLCSYLKGSQTQKGKSFSERPHSISFDSAQELSWTGRQEGREGRNSQFPLNEKECDREMNVLDKSAASPDRPWSQPWLSRSLSV